MNDTEIIEAVKKAVADYEKRADIAFSEWHRAKNGADLYRDLYEILNKTEGNKNEEAD